jgi:site-specific recombinase XerD
MANFQFYCRESKTDKNGYSPIEISINIDGRRNFIQLPRKEKPANFKKLVASRKRNDLQEYLEISRSHINKAITEITKMGKALTAPALKDYVKNGGIKLYTIEDLFNEHYQIIKMQMTDVNYDKYVLVRDEFFKYIDPKRDINEINNAVVRGFMAELFNTYKPSTATGKINKLKSTIKFALANHKLMIDPFNGIKIARVKSRIEYLTDSEVNLIKNAPLYCKRLEQVRDLFLFQVGSGLSYADMATLSSSDVMNSNGTYYIQKNRQKTDIEYTAILLPIALEIFNKYDGILPIISNQKMNSYLKEIQILSHLEKPLHSHLARKTYCTHLLNKGVRMDVVSKCAGHSNTRITAAIYAHLQTSTIIDEVAKII